jgi:subtilase-type serine protease
MSRLLGSTAHAALIAVLVSSLPSNPAKATDFVVDSGQTDNAAKTVIDQDTLTVKNGGTLDVDDDAITWSGASPAPGILIDNAGTITATGRGIDTKKSNDVRSITFINERGANFTADDDGFRINTDVTSGTITFDNAGTFVSHTGQAIDFDAIDSNTATITINNRSTGEIRADDADAIRPGEGGVVNNWGKITSFSSTPDPSNDGVDFQGHAGTVNNYTGGVISGARHGITSDVGVTVYNEAGGTIIGRNGSGVGSDGDGTVENLGTITGAIDDTSVNGDGDGVDIDGLAKITNTGIIQGIGAKGEKDGSANTSEGIAIGGGTIDNLSANSVISGKDNGILVDDSNAGSAPFATQINNQGTIRGENGFAIRIIGTQADTLTNSGLIDGENGSAVDLGGGDDTLNVRTGAQFIGLVDGGDGNDKITLDGAGTFAGGVNFETLDVKDGDWTLTGTQSYASGTTLDAGKLSVDGTLDSKLTTSAGSILAGNGTIDSATISGTIAPGHSIGKLTFTNDYTQTSGSTYEVELNTSGQSDLIDVKGAATLAGSVVVEAAGGQYQLGSQYTILTAAGGITGGYTGSTDALPFIDFTVASDANNVYLDVKRNAVTFQSVATTTNARNVATAAQNLGPGNAVFDAISSVASDNAARAAFNGLSGEIYASANGIMLEDSRFVREAVLNRVGNGLESASKAEGLWGQAFGAQGTFDGDGNAAGIDRSIGGVFVGVDKRTGENGRIGLAAGYSHASLDADGRNSSQDRDDFHVALYGGTHWGALGLRVGAAYTWNELETTRRFVLPGGAGEVKGDESAGTAQVFGELGYDINIGATTFEPFAGIAYVNLNTDGFTEHGNVAALSSDGGSEDLPTTTLGLRAATSFLFGNANVLTALGMLGWRHALDDVKTTETLAFAGGSSFSVDGVPIAQDTLMIGAGVDMNFTPDVSVGLSYTGEIGSDAQDHGIKGNLSWKF